MTDTIMVDPDMRAMLDGLMDFYVTDEPHLIRALLRERIKRIESVKRLEGPEH